MDAGVDVDTPALGDCLHCLFHRRGDAHRAEDHVRAATAGQRFHLVGKGVLCWVNDGVGAYLPGEGCPFRVGLADENPCADLLGEQEMEHSHHTRSHDNHVVGPLDPGFAHAAHDAGQRFCQADLLERRLVIGLVQLVIFEEDVLCQAGGAGHIGLAERLAHVVADVVQTAPACLAVAAAGQH